jgi:hypothetical protein
MTIVLRLTRVTTITGDSEAEHRETTPTCPSRVTLCGMCRCPISGMRFSYDLFVNKLRREVDRFVAEIREVEPEAAE